MTFVTIDQWRNIDAICCTLEETEERDDWYRYVEVLNHSMGSPPKMSTIKHRVPGAYSIPDMTVTQWIQSYTIQSRRDSCKLSWHRRRARRPFKKYVLLDTGWLALKCRNPILKLLNPADGSTANLHLSNTSRCTAVSPVSNTAKQFRILPECDQRECA